MQYNLKGTNVDLTAELRAYIDKKLGGLDALLHNAMVARTDVELEYRESEEKTYRAEFMLHDAAVIRAEARGSTMHEAIDRATQELFSELSRAKKVKRGMMRRTGVRVKEFLRGWRNRP